MKYFPSIEFKTFEHTTHRRPKTTVKSEEKAEETDEEDEIPDLPEDPDVELQDLLLRFSKIKLKGEIKKEVDYRIGSLKITNFIEFFITGDGKMY